MTGLPLSVLDLAPVQEGTRAAEALSATIALACRAERFGYHRFWVAEHHNSPATAGSAPAVLIAALAAATSRIRVGSGGVMLPNHVPLVVAEQFGTLVALAPDRVDLGVGRGPGTADETTARALRRGAGPVSAEEYAHDVTTVLGLFTEDSPAPVLRDGVPEIWLLSSSESGAGLAAGLGLPLSFAHHLRPAATGAALARYRERFRPSARLDRPRVMVSVEVVCAETDERADQLMRPADLFEYELTTRWAATLPTPQQARAHRLTEHERVFVQERRRWQAVGSPETVARQLARLTEAVRPDELMLTMPVYDPEDRARSLELVAGLSDVGTASRCR
ncbi:LLM class flavin-dependent oxidoreductase [Streptomyces albicerus]|uniref:LLM class flavin-dependent oxidoreductase n=1 Tax=Streptomyces albicerus TaxID=2569859 RepID=UPI00124AE68F|nr:LLM class flavin-dependent oxidoreductase [Streptomyces albicerus]